MKEDTWCKPVACAIIQRDTKTGIEIFVQTRWKPQYKNEYSGLLEIPAGKIDAYENIHECLKREVLEETGLRVKSIYPNVKSSVHNPRKNDTNIAFVPYCVAQMLSTINDGLPWIGIVFICEVEEGEIVSQESETRNGHWIKKEALLKILNETPEQIFTLHLGALEMYLNNLPHPNPLH